jgi:hypothetical protein
MRKTTPAEMAKLIFNDFYILLDKENGENTGEMLLTIYSLALKAAIRSVKLVISANPHSNPLNTDVHPTMEWWEEVLAELKKHI